ncbi:TrbC/VirB2 family protein [Luteibacter sp.]|jgi:type IV secretion system protein VirB2|uniref:TrbC/VirB2 family protein n=1 Tax=Luteibacter sp. TaxID=1886636 RepID=UPI002F408564
MKTPGFMSSIKGMWRWPAAILICTALLALPGLAIADEGPLPYEGGLVALQDSFTGTVPFVISLAGIVGCGAMLIFGGEISGFMRTMVFIVLVVAVIVQASTIITFLKDGTTGGGGGKVTVSLVKNDRTNV